MKKRSLTSYRNSDLDRAKPRKRLFHSFINNKLKQPKRHHSDTGLVEDRTSSTTIVRIIAGILMVHVVVIGGLLVRGNLVKSNTGLAVTPGVTPPPTAPAATQPAEQAVVPGPVNMNAVLTPATTVPAPQPMPAQTHITQATAPPSPAQTAPVQPVISQPQQAPVVATPTAAPAQPANTTLTKHMVASGDTWDNVAMQYSITVNELKAANPQAAANANLFTGTYLSVPVSADSAAGQAAMAAQQQAAEEARGTVHVVKKGETLGVIARKYRISLKKLYSLNNLTEKDARRIQPGRELKVGE